jgi:hypothetical protein
MSNGRDPGEILEAFGQQKEALAASCASFDAGRRWEGFRIAAAISTLVDDRGRNNKSLLTHLGLKDTVRFIASGMEINKRNILPSHPLVGFRFDGDDVEYSPKLSRNSEVHRLVAFDEWWEQDLIYWTNEGSGLSLTRRTLVRSLRD